MPPLRIPRCRSPVNCGAAVGALIAQHRRPHRFFIDELRGRYGPRPQAFFRSAHTDTVGFTKVRIPRTNLDLRGVPPAVSVRQVGGGYFRNPRTLRGSGAAVSARPNPLH